MRRGLSSIAAAWACLALSGCFYLETINQRPAIDIIQRSSENVYRRSVVQLEADAHDPEGQIVFYTWRAYACVDANDFATCDGEPFYTEVLAEAEFVVPETLADQATPTQSILVYLEAQDEYGAIARPRQQLIIPVADHAPVLGTRLEPHYRSVVGAPIDLFLVVSDSDDGPANVALEWTVFSPITQPSYTFVDLDVPDPKPEVELQVGKRITPMGEGRWEVQVVGTDPLGATDTQSFAFDVKPDGAPCLAQWAPIAPPAGSSYPLTEATLFQIAVISDDLDPYPAVPGDSILGTSSFSWSIKQPGAATRTSLGFTGNGIALDPANYTPGDVVELRVEIADRNNTPINCADSAATCSVISDNACIQRLTWRVEVH